MFPQKSILQIVILALVVCLESYASEIRMKRFLIDLPPRRIAFSLPDEIANEMSPRRIDSSFDIRELDGSNNQFNKLAAIDYFFKGPIWVGNYGLLKFNVIVHKRIPEMGGSVSTVLALEDYIRVWCGSSSSSQYSQLLSVGPARFNGLDCVRRTFDNTSDSQVAEPTSIDIYSLPLGENHFLDFGFIIDIGTGGRTRMSKWRPRAEELKKLILDSIRLEFGAKTKPSFVP